MTRKHRESIPPALMSLAMLQPQAPKAGTPAAAAPAAHEAQPSGHDQAPPPSMGFFGSPIFLMLLFLPFIFMMWRRNKRETEARSKMKKGDKVLAGGLVGELMDQDDRMAKVKIAPGVTVQVLVSALSPLEEPKPAPAADAKNAPKDMKAKAESK